MALLLGECRIPLFHRLPLPRAEELLLRERGTVFHGARLLTVLPNAIERRGTGGGKGFET